MIEMVQEHKVKNYNASQAGIVSEFTSEQLEEKFAEYMVALIFINILVFSTTGIAII